MNLQARWVRRAALSACCLLLAAIVLAPLAAAAGFRGSALLYAIFSPHCHQIADRCFHVSGYPLAVCGRCLGVYLGFFLGALLYPLTPCSRRKATPSLTALAVFSLPMAVDVAGNLFQFWVSPLGLRLAAGGIWGIVLPWYFIPGAAEAVVMLKSKNLHLPWKKT
jgi:uncharacterized membrane protein